MPAGQGNVSLNYRWGIARAGGDVTTILTLPVEIFVEIFKLVGFLDILRIRRTCKYCHGITTAKFLWIHLFWECERLSPGILTLEKTLDFRQRAVLADHPWSSNRTILTSHFKTFYLVPGGRWLLVFYTDSRIIYHDLDSSEHNIKRDLVPDYARHTDANKVDFTVDIPDRLPIQRFKVAQYLREGRTTDNGEYQGIKIWNIEFVLEGHLVTGLRANCLNTIAVDSMLCYSVQGLSLRNEFLAFRATSELQVQRADIFVVDWKCVQDGSLDYPRRTLSIEAEAPVHLFPNERLATLSMTRMSVRDFSSLDYDHSMPEAYVDPTVRTVKRKPPKICSLKLQNHHSFQYVQLSAPFMSNHGVRFLALASGTIQAITIPDDLRIPGSSNSNLSVEKLIPVPPHALWPHYSFRYCFGSRHGILYHTDPTYRADRINPILLEYHPEQQFEKDYVPVEKSFPCRNELNMLEDVTRSISEHPPLVTWTSELASHNHLFDDGSGRLVVPFPTHFEVLDFALVYKEYQHTA
ncbi:hypothetical protein D9613_005674 [Agrocybe pediades]|uniref:F-box domain-containing protein n=1 Tax=Agrocybe pediades TaxID=84607 RepID=A0A8H4QVI2_9AGAR|nr:hypothetical protein D9613_005674 [Agrocybe pediades]